MTSTGKHQWKPTRFDLFDHYAFVARYGNEAGPGPEGKPWHAYKAHDEVDSWHATAAEAKAAVEAAIKVGADQ